jgi:thiol-disulfide isomerase/thioredoxin
MKRLFLLLFVLALVPGTLRAQSHEYAPLQEKTINYKNWTLNDLANNQPVSLRSLMQGKKLVMLLYFAPWCPNWRNEAPVAANLYNKYKPQGFEIIGVSEYGTRADVKSYFGANGAPYPVVSESESREDRDKTPHYAYRQLTGDTRKWGSPYNVFLEPGKCTANGDVLTEKAWVVNGELIEADVDKFIHDRLATTSAAITPCKQ